MTPSKRLAAGHSGQNKTTMRSEMRWSKMARYSASFEFLVVFVFPDRCVRKSTIVFAAFVADSRADPYSRISYFKPDVKWKQF